MKIHYFLAIVIFIVTALGIGWFYDEKLPLGSRDDFQVPDNIDYYLSQVNYRSMNEQGSLHYLLTTPYLEHYIREDISHIQRPNIRFNGNRSTWLMQSLTATLTHRQELFELQQQVELKNDSHADPLLLNTDLMILKPRDNIIEIPLALTLLSNNLDLKAESARIDMNNNQYRFHAVKAVYQMTKPVRNYEDS